MEVKKRNIVKKYGVKGRTTSEDIFKRREIIKEILDNNSNISITDIKKKLSIRFIGQGKDGTDLIIPTDETLKKDWEEKGYIYKKGRFELNTISPSTEQMAKEIFKSNVIEINATYKNKQYFFYPLLFTHQHEYLEDNNNVLTSEVIQDYADDMSGDYYYNLLNTLTNSVETNYDLIQISIIFKQHEYEQTLAEIFYNILKNNISFITVNICSIQIYFKKQDFNNIFDFIFNVLPDTNLSVDTLILYSNPNIEKH